MQKKYFVAIIIYISVIILALLSILAGGEKNDGFFDFSGLAAAFGIGLALVGTFVFGLYILLVYTYSRGRQVFIITLFVVAGLLIAAAGVGLTNKLEKNRSQLDFSSAILLQPGVTHMEPDHSQSLVTKTKYKYLPIKDGNVTINLIPVGWDDQISGLNVYDFRKKSIVNHYGIVPSQVKVSGVKSDSWIYITVQTATSYDVYDITVSQ